MVTYCVTLALALFATADAALGKKFRKVSIGDKGYPATPSWGDHASATFKVEGAGDALYDGCYVFSRFDSSDAFSLAYVNSENPNVYLHFSQWRGCGALVPSNCRHNGWWLSQMMCRKEAPDTNVEGGIRSNRHDSWEELSCKGKAQEDGYFAVAQVEGGKILDPTTLHFGCPPMMDGSTLHPEARAVRQDSDSTMYASNCDEPAPKITMNTCSAKKPAPKKAPAPRAGAAQLTLLVPVALIAAVHL
jgi:hypothetical protein